MIYLYMRVSTGKQELDTQERDLGQRFPQGLVYKETASGVKQRPKLEELVAKLQKGDTLAVAALDRLGRKTSDILNLIETLQRRGVNVISLREGVDYSTPTGRLVTQILSACAELERNLISQRTIAALAAKKASGVQLGRRATYSDEVIARAHELRSKDKTYLEITQETGISKTHLGRIFAKTRAA